MPTLSLRKKNKKTLRIEVKHAEINFMHFFMTACPLNVKLLLLLETQLVTLNVNVNENKVSRSSCNSS